MRATTTMNSLKTKSDLHILRKVFHFFGVVTIMACYHNMPFQSSVKLLLGVCAFIFTYEAVRLNSAKFNKFAVIIMGPFMRESERDSPSGLSSMLLGALIIILIFPKIIAVLSFAFLAVADPTASYIGVRYGKDKLIGNKSLQGATAAFVCCSIISIVYFIEKELFIDRILFVALLSGLIGSASELIKVKNLDDNLTLPVLSSCFLWILFKIFGGI